MPQGEIISLSKTGHGVIVASSGRYAVHVDDMEPKAQVSGAFVEFDVQHEDPQDRAVNVRLREGTRNAHTQRRFGDRGGARD